MVEIPILSICIPAYNRPLWFRRGLQSITERNPPCQSKVEIVITDDSDDCSCQAIAEEILGGWRYRYEHHEKALGMAQNWNRAVTLAQGNYVMILHDDDFFIPGGLEQLVACLTAVKGQYPVILSGVWVVDGQERLMKRQVFRTNQFLSPHDALIRLFSHSSFVRFPAIAIERSLFDKVGYFRPEWQEPCDVEMWMRLFAQYGVYCCEAVTVAYRVHSQALTMASFHEKTVEILLRLFEELAKFNILSGSELEECKQLFFHQYILAGAWRQLRRGRWDTFKAVMGLWQLPELGAMPWTPKWWFFRSLFTALARLLHP